MNRQTRFTSNRIIFLVLLLLLAACDSNANDTVLPTQMELPSPMPTEPDVSGEGAVAQAPTEDIRSTLPPSWTPTPATETATGTATASATVTLDVTASATITDTPSATFTITPTSSPQPGALSDLIQTAQVATVAPTVPFETQQAIISTSQAFGTPQGVIVPPPSGPTTQCQFPPPGDFNRILQVEPGLIDQLGCPIGAPPTVITMQAAYQNFERGQMNWVFAEPPGFIYVLFNNGTFRRFDDTFDPNVDPDSAGETPPEGLIEPIRGFGKIWRSDPGLRDALGWATTGETPTPGSIAEFARGRMILFREREGVIILFYGADATSGNWRSAALPGGSS